MLEIPDFANSEATEEWLALQNRPTIITLATRSVIRAFPNISTEGLRPLGSISPTLLVFFRVMLSMTCVATGGLAKPHGGARLPEQVANDIDANLKLIHASISPSFIGAVQASRVGSYEASVAGAKVAIESGRQSFRRLAQEGWALECARDAYVLTSKESDYRRSYANEVTCFSTPLWSDSPVSLKAATAARWQRISRLLEAEPSWEFWQRWYQSVGRGAFVVGADVASGLNSK